MHLRHGRHGRPARVERIGQLVDRDDAIRVQQEQGESRPLSRAAQLQRAVVGDDLDRPEDPEPQHAETVSVGKKVGNHRGQTA